MLSDEPVLFLRSFYSIINILPVVCVNRLKRFGFSGRSLSSKTRDKVLWMSQISGYFPGLTPILLSVDWAQRKKVPRPRLRTEMTGPGPEQTSHGNTFHLFQRGEECYEIKVENPLTILYDILTLSVIDLGTPYLKLTTKNPNMSHVGRVDICIGVLGQQNSYSYSG